MLYWNADTCFEKRAHVFRPISDIRLKVNFSSSHSCRSRDVKKSWISAGCLRCQVWISGAHLSLIRFPFAFQLQGCLKSYGREDENSWKKDIALVCTHLSLCLVCLHHFPLVAFVWHGAHLTYAPSFLSFLSFFNTVPLHSLKYNSQRLNRRNRG